VAVSSMMATSNNTPANDDFHRLLLVVKELAQQLDENRQAATKLKLHADLLKEHIRVGSLSDPSLLGNDTSSNRRKAVDEFLAERDDLLRENQSLRQENQELSELVRDYERGLEVSASLIRDHAYQASIRTTQIHQDYNLKLNLERIENDRLQQAVTEAEARLIKVSGLLRQAHAADHDADRSVDQALLDLQTQNRGLRVALGLPVDAGIDLERDLLFVAKEGGGGDSQA